MGERDGNPWLVGMGALSSGVVSGIVVAIDGNGQIGAAFTGEQPTIYGPSQVALAVVLALAGLLLLLVRTRVATAALLGVIGLCAAQLAGTGLVGFRRWPHFWGASGFTVTEQDLVRALALVVAVVCAVAATGGLVVLISGRYVHWRGVDLPVVVAFAVALVVAVAGPRLVVGDWDDDVEGLAAWALMYSLPFAAALAVSALMHRLAALVTTWVVASSALIATAGQSFLESIQPSGDAQSLVIVGAAAVAATRLLPGLERSSDEATRSSRWSNPSAP